MKIFVTGGTGFIGSHTCVEFLKKGHEVLIYDNLHNSCEGIVMNIRRLGNSDVKFLKADIRD